MMVQKEIKFNGEVDSIWMTLVKDGNEYALAFTNEVSLIGKIGFSFDEDLASGIFNYLTDRFEGLNFSLIDMWINKLLAMNTGNNVFFYLAVADKELTIKEIKKITKRVSMDIEEDEFQVFVKNVNTAVGKFVQITNEKFKFKFDI